MRGIADSSIPKFVARGHFHEKDLFLGRVLDGYFCFYFDQ